jgi:hypothetical protein
MLRAELNRKPLPEGQDALMNFAQECCGLLRCKVRPRRLH